MESIATTLHEIPVTLSMRRLSPALGVEILGVDLRDPISDALEKKLLDAWHRHLVILLRHQTLDETLKCDLPRYLGRRHQSPQGAHSAQSIRR
jgi:alpha-ketoglutarate-dependent taurine dioxygenase